MFTFSQPFWIWAHLDFLQNYDLLGSQNLEGGVPERVDG